MATYRIGIGSFNLKDNAVGIGTESSGLGNLKVEGSVKTTDLDVTGVSTFTRYAGFAADNINIVNIDRTLTGEHSSTGDIIVGVNSIFTVSTGATVTVGTVESVSIGTHFSPPTGGVEERPEAVHEGMVRFNKDLNTLEFYNGVDWRQFTINGASGRAIFGAGRTPGDTRNMEYINLISGGKGINFGDLNLSVNSQADSYKFGNSNEIRALFGGGYQSPSVPAINNIDYVTIASAGDGIDFGDLVTSSGIGVAVSSSTRGIQAGGWVSSSPDYDTNVIQYVEIMTKGNSLDFGDLLAKRRSQAGAQSPTRGLFAGGETQTPNYHETSIEQITIASKGNSTTFGDMSFRKRFDTQNISNSTRGIFAGFGYYAARKEIDYVTIASEGNGTYFGDLSQPLTGCSGAASQTRGIVASGGNPSLVTTVESVIISTTGNATYFGDLSLARFYSTGISDSHGGLGGY